MACKCREKRENVWSGVGKGTANRVLRDQTEKEEDIGTLSIRKRGYHGWN